MKTNASRIAPSLGVAALGLALWLGLLNGQLGPAQAAPSATIQSMIDAASDGGTVSIPAGTYNESLTVNKNLTLTGVTSATTIIQAASGWRVITVTSGHNLRLQNLTLTGGQSGSAEGGGVRIDNGYLQVVDSLIVSNSAVYGGGIFQGGSGRVDMTGSRVERNRADNHGGGLYVNGDLALTSTQVLTNTATGHGGGLTVWSGRTVVTGGSLEGNQAGQNGGGLNANNGVTLGNVRVISNTAGQDGGGVLQWNIGQPVSVTGSYFERNTAQRDGGGLWAQGNLTVTASSFISNSADSRGAANTDGGGLYAGGQTLLVSASTFRGNRTECLACSFLYGGGLYAAATVAATVQDSLFDGNSSWFGGGLSAEGTITIRRATFQGNWAGYGGGLYSYSASTDIRDSVFLGNRAANGGGGLRALGPAVSLSGVRIISNTANYGGGLLLGGVSAVLSNTVVADNVGWYSGTGMDIRGPSARLWHTTVARNSGGDGSGVYIVGNSVVAMTNTIVVSHTRGITVAAGSQVRLDGVLWHNNTVNASGAGTVTVLHAVTGNPAFAADGYHLSAGSAAINQGVSAGPPTDIDGDPRPVGPLPDLGADEYIQRLYLPLVVR